MIHALLRKASVAKEAETRHAGIYLDMDVELFPQRDSRSGILLRLGKAGNRLRNVMLDQTAGILPGCMPENQNWHGNTAGTQLQCLIQTGNRQIIGTAILQKHGNPEGTVAVGIRLYNAKKAASGWNVASDGFIVMSDIRQADFGPGSLLKIIHFPCICVSFF